MNVKLYDGTSRCADHCDASTFQGVTSDPCLYCPTTQSHQREVSLAKIQCAWCCAPATWALSDGFGTEHACTVHGTEWYPHLFPESDTAPIETIIGSIDDKIRPDNPVGAPERTRLPALAPLFGHRDGLRRNDLVTLASAFWILALEGGTDHMIDPECMSKAYTRT